MRDVISHQSGENPWAVILIEAKYAFPSRGLRATNLSLFDRVPGGESTPDFRLIRGGSPARQRLSLHGRQHFGRVPLGRDSVPNPADFPVGADPKSHAHDS